jgi:hypothetical protein
MCIVDGDGGVVDRKTIEHTGAGMAQLVKRLEELTGVEPGLAAVGIEVPRGAIVECLIEHRLMCIRSIPSKWTASVTGTR